MADCIFCKIVAGEIPSNRVYEDADVIAIRDLAPQAKDHVLVIPRIHVANMAEATEVPGLAEKVMAAAVKVAGILGLTERGYRLVANTGDDGRQSVHHLHVHVLGGEKLTEHMGAEQ